MTLEPNQHSSLVLAYVQVVEVLESLGMVSDALKYLDVAHDLSEKFTNAVITGTMMTIQAKLVAEPTYVLRLTSWPSCKGRKNMANWKCS